MDAEEAQAWTTTIVGPTPEEPYQYTYVYIRRPPRVWIIDAVSIIAAFWWAFCLFADPHLLARNVTYSALWGQPQWTWALFALSVALIQLAVARVKRLRRFTHGVVLLTTFFWLSIGLLYLAQSLTALGGGVHIAIAIGVALRLWRW